MIYTDKSAVENHLLISINVSFDTQLAAWMEAMSRYADNLCGVTLVDTTPSTRLYDGNGEIALKIDDVNTITAVTVGGVVVTPYQIPANSTRKYLLDLDNECFTVGKQNVSVTGVFARFVALPADIKFAVTVLVAGIVNQSNKQTDGVKSETIGAYQVVYKDDKERADYARAISILEGYRKIAF